MKRRAFLKVTLPLVFVKSSAAVEPDAAELSFAVIADPQYADADPIATRFYRNSLSKLETAITDLNARKLDFTVTLGDLIDRDFVSFSSVMERYTKLKSTHYPILGNHDFSVADADKTNVLAAIGLEKSYHSQVIKGWRLVFLDGSDTSVWRHAANDPRTAAAKKTLNEMAKKLGRTSNPGDTAIGAVQMAWLEKELAAAKEAKQRVILFNHYPIFPAVPANLLDASEVISLIDRFDNVAAWMNGHNHQGNYAQKAHCHYVNFKGMVETEKDSAYAVVHCYANRIEIEGNGLEPDRKLDAM